MIVSLLSLLFSGIFFSKSCLPFFKNKTIMEEIWKDISGFEGLYMVSSMGRVKSVRYKRILRGWVDKEGYAYVHIKNKSYKVHRLVAQAFIPNPDNKPYIDHIDTNPSNNRVENLRWATPKENSNNPLTRRKISLNKLGKYGKEAIKSIPVIQLSLDNKFIREWECGLQVQREAGIWCSHIMDCCKGRRKTTGGFKWIYKE